MVRQQVAVGVVRVGLGEDGAPVGQPHGPRVAEAPHARERAEVVVEAAVLLHQQDDVLDLAQVEAGRVGAGDGLAHAGGQVGGQGRPGGGAGPSLQELAAGERGGQEVGVSRSLGVSSFVRSRSWSGWATGRSAVRVLGRGAGGAGATGPPAVVVGTVKPVTTRTLLLEVSAM